MIVGLLWSIFFIEGIRVIMLTNWYFDILRANHWLHAWNLWISGWVIDEPKEWAFVLIVLSMVPVWVTVWAALSAIKWEKLLKKFTDKIMSLFGKAFEKQLKHFKEATSVKTIQKKKSYKEIRPKAATIPVESSLSAPKSIFDEEKRAALSGAPLRPKLNPPAIPPAPTKNTEPKEFSHSLFNMDEDPLDFDLFEETVAPKKQNESAKNNNEKSEESAKNTNKADKKPNQSSSTPQNNTKKTSADEKQQTKNKTTSENSTLEQLKQKGYDVITGATIKNTFIDFIGISKSQICLCLNDKEPGDWLADEERFNDEEPLWFSESSHRISPVCKIHLAKSALEEKLKDADFSFEVVPFVIEQIGNIINAEDMLDIWHDLNVKVTRIDRGSPKEIPLFAKGLEEAEEKVDKSVLEKLKKLIRNIA